MVREINNKDNAYFIQRLGAFVIDFLIVYFIASLIATPFVDSKKLDSLTKESTEVLNNYIEKSIDEELFVSKYESNVYQIARLSGTVSLITITLSVCYYVVFQLYKNGQTIGKQLMKIRVVSLDGNLTMNQMIFRAFLSNSILSDIICFLFLISNSKKVYFFGTGFIEMIQFIIIIISIFMVMNRNNGRAIHDRVAHTKVIRV